MYVGLYPGRHAPQNIDNFESFKSSFYYILSLESLESDFALKIPKPQFSGKV